MTGEAKHVQTEEPAALLTLDPGETGVVGGMVVENIGSEEVNLAVRGDGAVIRDKMIITAEDAVSPALKVYFMVMTMYKDPDLFLSGHKEFLTLSRELITAVPSTGMIMADIGENLIIGDFRAAFEACFELMAYEQVLEEAAPQERPGGPQGQD